MRLRPASLLSNRLHILLCLLLLLLIIVPLLLARWWSAHGIPYDELHNLAAPHLASFGLGSLAATVEPPEDIPALLELPWAGSYRVPSLYPNCSSTSASPMAVREWGRGRGRRRRDEVGQEDGESELDMESELGIADAGESLEEAHPPSAPNGAGGAEAQHGAALLMIHFFSTAKHSAIAKARRSLIRRTIYQGVPHRLRGLVQYKFVMGMSWDPAVEHINDNEERRWKDMIRLPLPGGEGEQGKVIEWARRVVRMYEEGRGRGAVWVVKCEDDVIPVLPNLLPFLLANNPSLPTFFGSSLRTQRDKLPYFAKPMFGFSWGVFKTLASANFPDEVREKDGDMDINVGELMYNLPSQPGAPPLPPPRAQTRISHAPRSPDPRTGLVWLDAGRRISHWKDWWTAKGGTALAWYGMVDDWEYEDDALKAIIQDVRAQGRRYWWDAPPHMEMIAGLCRDELEKVRPVDDGGKG